MCEVEFFGRCFFGNKGTVAFFNVAPLVHYPYYQIGVLESFLLSGSIVNVRTASTLRRRVRALASMLRRVSQ